MWSQFKAIKHSFKTLRDAVKLNKTALNVLLAGFDVSDIVKLFTQLLTYVKPL